MENIDLLAYVTARDQALAACDLKWIKEQLKKPDLPDLTALIVLHKSRLECTNISLELRTESLEWLRERSFSRMNGKPLPTFVEEI